jgi:hypothetical protein
MAKRSNELVKQRAFAGVRTTHECDEAGFGDHRGMTSEMLAEARGASGGTDHRRCTLRLCVCQRTKAPAE